MHRIAVPFVIVLRDDGIASSGYGDSGRRQIGQFIPVCVFTVDVGGFRSDFDRNDDRVFVDEGIARIAESAFG